MPLREISCPVVNTLLVFCLDIKVLYSASVNGGSAPALQWCAISAIARYLVKTLAATSAPQPSQWDWTRL